MKKISFVSLMSLLFLSLCSFFTYELRNVNIENEWIALGIGVGILALSGALASIAKNNVIANSICFIINSFALGLCIRSWYMYRNYDNELWVMILISLVCVIYLLIFYLLLYIPWIEKHINKYIWVFLISTLVVYLVVMFLSETTYISTFGYYVIIEISFILAMCHNQNTLKHLFRDIVLSTYSIFIVAVIIALIMLDGDALDGFDLSGVDDPMNKIDSPKKRKVSL